MIPRNQFRQPMYSLAGRYGNPIATWFLAPLYCLKIPLQANGSGGLVQRERRVEVGMQGAEHMSVLKVEMGEVSDMQ